MTYKLWTFQAITSIKQLQSEGILEAGWDVYKETDPFSRAYRWMVRQMNEFNISCNDKAPIWAWHSCGKYESPPRLVDARALLSDIDLGNDIHVIAFECPVELALLSSYMIWNRILYEYFHEGIESDIDELTVKKLYETSKPRFRRYDSIQASLPFLKLDWVKEIRRLKLKPNDFSFNPEENA